MALERWASGLAIWISARSAELLLALDMGVLSSIIDFFLVLFSKENTEIDLLVVLSGTGGL